MDKLALLFLWKCIVGLYTGLWDGRDILFALFTRFLQIYSMETFVSLLIELNFTSLHLISICFTSRWISFRIAP